MFDWFRRVLHPSIFEVVLERGRARAVKGDVKGAFLNDCADAARFRGIERGRIFGVRSRGGIRLEFSKEIPTEARQAFRNVWGVHRGGG